MVQVHLGPPLSLLMEAVGGVAQLGERLLCTQEVIGSIPVTSTSQTPFSSCNRWSDDFFKYIPLMCLKKPLASMFFDK